MTTTERFWDKIDVGSPDECWLWNAHVVRGGYGQFRVDGKLVQVHRYSFFLHHGFYPPVVMHTCDNPPCINPFHLLAGTTALNIADCVAKGRHGSSKKTHCLKGHLFDEENTYINPSGARVCRKCRSVHKKKYRIRKEAGY